MRVTIECMTIWKRCETNRPWCHLKSDSGIFLMEARKVTEALCKTFGLRDETRARNLRNKNQNTTRSTTSFSSHLNFSPWSHLRRTQKKKNSDAQWRPGSQTLSQGLALRRSIKTWLSDAQSRPGARTLSQGLALGRSIKTWLSDAQSRPGARARSQDLALGRCIQNLALGYS